METVFWQNKRANLITEAAVQMGFKFFCRRWHDAAKTSPLLFLIRKSKPTKVLFFDWDITRLSLWIESEIGGCDFVVCTSATWFCLCCTSINSNWLFQPEPTNLGWGSFILKYQLVSTVPNHSTYDTKSVKIQRIQIF